MSNSMTVAQWILVLVGSSVVPLIGVIVAILMECTRKKPAPKKKHGKRRGKRRGGNRQ